MKRPALVTVIASLQSLLALILAAGTVYLVWLAHSPQILAEPDGADAAHGIMIGAVAAGGTTVIVLISCWGLWKNKRWGWWLAMMVHVIIVAVMGYGTVDDSPIDMDSFVITLCFLAFLIFLLIPKVRKFYLRGAIS